jgi:hypothetical protein
LCPGNAHLAVRLVPRDWIDDCGAFREALQALAYRPIKAAQEP